MAARKTKTRGSSGGRSRNGRRGAAPRVSRGAATRGGARGGRSRSTGRRNGRDPADAVALLVRDHEQVEAMFKRFERAKDGDKSALAKEICRALDVHTRIEEELLYPAAREALTDEDLVVEAEVEHESAKDLIQKIGSTSPGDERYEAYVTVLGEYVRHHVREEQDELFPKLRKARSLDLQELGRTLATRKAELEARA